MCTGVYFWAAPVLLFLFAFVRIKLVRQQDSKTVHTQCSCWPIWLSVVYFSVADTREQTILSNIKSFISDLLIVCRKEPNQSETLSVRFSSLLKFINVKNNCSLACQSYATAEKTSVFHFTPLPKSVFTLDIICRALSYWVFISYWMKIPPQPRVHSLQIYWI